MSETDPHIHVQQKVLEAGPIVRNLIVSMLGRVTDAPSVVSTGCGVQVHYAMTSPRPESVTCLACREHAHREYLRFADQVERLGRPGPMPGMNIRGGGTAPGPREEVLRLERPGKVVVTGVVLQVAAVKMLTMVQCS